MCFGLKGRHIDCKTCHKDNMKCTHFNMHTGIVLIRENTYIITDTYMHEDFKTVLARLNDYPYLLKGDKVTFLGPFRNLYGNFAKVKTESGRIYDINPKHLCI